jgi:hypothetical protein
MKTITTALLSLMVCAAPASANYFFNSQWGTMLNVGSAPNPTPDQLRAIGDSNRGGDVRRSDRPVSTRRASAAPTTFTAIPTTAAVIPASTSVIIPARTNASPREEPRVTAQLNRASLIQARAVASDAPAVKTTKAAAATNKKTAVKAAANAKSGKKSRV